MPVCPECQTPMATVMHRKGEVVRTYYECPTCTRRPSLPAQEEAEPQGPRSSSRVR
jgi:uncharacterized Zn finger protein (UPF0148 family)